METVRDFIFLGSKITADGDYSLEIERRLFLGRKAMTSLDSVLKSRDITLPTKICLVKAMVFPVAMYGCESWTIKKIERWRIDALNFHVGEDPWTARSSNHSNLKEISAEYLLEGLMLKLKPQYFCPSDVKSRLIGKDPDTGKESGQEEKVTTEDEVVVCHHRLNGHDFEQTPGDGEGQWSLVCCSPWGHKELDTTERLNWADSCYLHLGKLGEELDPLGRASQPQLVDA